MDIPVRYRPAGNMDSDSTPENVRNGNYSDALNVRGVPNQSGDGAAIENILGNGYERSFIIESPSAQNKQLKFNLNNQTPGVQALALIYASPNGLTFTINFTTTADINTSIDNFVAGLDTALSSYGGAVEISREITNANFGNVVVEFGNFINWQSYSVDPVTFLGVVQEAIPLNAVGDPIVIGSTELNGNLFIFSTPTNSLSATYKVVDVSDTAPIVITTLEDHGLVTGAEALISGVKGNTNANGIWTVTVLTTTTFSLDTSSNGPDSALMSITSLSDNGGLIQVEYLGDYELQTGDEVYIQGITGLVLALFTVTRLTATTVILNDTPYVGPYGGTGTIMKVAAMLDNPRSIGEIGVAVKSTIGNWTYARLLRSIEFNFRAVKQIDCDIEYSNDQYGLYFTDDYNPPRVFYYKGDFVTDGALMQVDSANIYEYGSIADETRLLVKNPLLLINLVTQNQSGGALLSGNWRYAARLLTASLNTSQWSYLSNPVPVYSASPAVPLSLLGDEAGVTTGKANTLEISNIDPDTFSFIELAALNYAGDAVQGFIVARYPITNSTMELTHFGNETETIELNAGEINQVQSNFVTAKNVRIIDNRLLLSNTTVEVFPDLSDWATAIEYRLLKGQFNGVGFAYNSNYKASEYYQPENVFYFSSYLAFETYRLAFRGRSRETGNWSQPYFVADITFDATAVGGQRVGTLTEFNLTDNPVTPPTDNVTYYYYLQFQNLDFNFVTENGKTIRELFDHIEFVRCEVENPTVLATGVVFTERDLTLVIPGKNEVLNNIWYFDSVATAGSTYVPTPVAAYTPGATDPERQIGAFYAPDFILGGGTLSYRAGDTFINFGTPYYMGVYTRGANTGGENNQNAVDAELYGYFDPSFTPGSLNVDAVQFAVNNQLNTVGGTNLYGNFYSGPNGLTIESFPMEPAYLFKLDSADYFTSPYQTDYGVYYAQYFRPNANQYGDIGSSRYVSIGAVYEIADDADTTTTYDVYGGDVYTQKTYLRVAIGDSDAGSGGINYGKIIGFYSQNRINSQLRFNSFGEVANHCIFPKGISGGASMDDRMNEVCFYDNNEPLEYNHGYDWWVKAVNDLGFDESLPVQAEFPTRIHFTPVKPNGSFIDLYRTFLPADFYDETLRWGPINHMAILNGELYTGQPLAWMRQYFNSRATIAAGEETSELLIRSASPFSIPGKVITPYGVTNKWGFVQGRTRSGYDTAHWINPIMKKWMRFGGDGTESIGDIKDVRAFIANNTNWVIDQDTPAAGTGICGIYNDRYSEVIFTVKGIYPADQWSVDGVYEPGDIVMYTPIVVETEAPSKSYLDFNQTPRIYVNIQATNEEPPTNTEYWEVQEYTNPDYYNLYTIVFTEARAGVQCFNSFLPKIYLQYRNTFLTPSPVTQQNYLYEHDKGNYCRWYVQNLGPGSGSIGLSGSTVTGVTTSFLDELRPGFGLLVGSTIYLVVSIESQTSLTIDTIGLTSANVVTTTLPTFSSSEYQIIQQQLEHGSITPVANDYPDERKTFVAEQYETEITPFRTEYQTLSNASYLTENEFKVRETNYISPIKRDSQSTGLNSGNTSKIYGRYMKAKLIFRYLIYQKFIRKVTKVRLRDRLSTK